MIDLHKLSAIQKITQWVAAVGLLVFFALIIFSLFQLNKINHRISAKTTELEKLEKEVKGLQAQKEELQKSIELSAEGTKKLVDGNPQFRQILPRLYIQISDESQRDRANKIAGLLQQQGYVVPGIENVGRKGAKVPDKTELRYYPDQPDTAMDLERLKAILGRAGVSYVPKALQYADPTKARPRHYELWFSSDY